MPNRSLAGLGRALGASPTPSPSPSCTWLYRPAWWTAGQPAAAESAKFYGTKSITITNHLVDSVWPCINLVSGMA